MGLVEITPALFDVLEQQGYTCVVQTSPSPLEEVHIQCARSKAVKYIPFKDVNDSNTNVMEMEGDEFRLSLEDAKNKFNSVLISGSSTKFLIDEKFLKVHY